METNDYLPDWAMRLSCAVTISDSAGNIIYMNQRSRDTFAEGTDRLIGRSLFECHGERSAAMIRHMLATGTDNSYTIEKRGVRKMIYQTPWRDASGAVAGLVEISMAIPAEMPHYARD